MDWKTFSGNKYQFDASFTADKTAYVIECKRKKSTTNESLFYFNAKLIDHLLVANREFQLEGIFLSTSPIERSARNYGISYGMRVIDPQWPPLEHLLLHLPSGSELRKAVLDLRDKIEDNRQSLFVSHRKLGRHDIYEQYEFLVSRFLRNLE